MFHLSYAYNTPVNSNRYSFHYLVVTEVTEHASIQADHRFEVTERRAASISSLKGQNQNPLMITMNECGSTTLVMSLLLGLD